MPKKFQGENSKSATARAQKAEVKAVADARKQKELEDALWQDNNKHVMKKEQRRVDFDREIVRIEVFSGTWEVPGMPKKFQGENSKSATARARKAEVKAVADARKQKELEDALCLLYPFESTEKSHLEMPLEENVNQIVPEEGTVEAQTIEDAIAVLSTKEDLDRHPEHRMKAAYAAFEEANMARLKMENPNMRLSQLKQQLKKEWTKSPENPLNQRVAAYNSK
ncbi:coiled-coil domain-containing protein 124-like [Sinocyclocheilus rhinocerous]|uniref:coiled-coil domain-containing protein 124-like n=1 Tax=Sinocyclocheilus rhinocerous TaxID=307959 RepID=UPI0007BABBA3|nr:PREDICTED: coiled-coil domain-containing protein 124-like [Sinocyclocheilus rhinocerous]